MRNLRLARTFLRPQRGQQVVQRYMSVQDFPEHDCRLVRLSRHHPVRRLRPTTLARMDALDVASRGSSASRQADSLEPNWCQNVLRADPAAIVSVGYGGRRRSSAPTRWPLCRKRNLAWLCIAQRVSTPSPCGLQAVARRRIERGTLVATVLEGDSVPSASRRQRRFVSKSSAQRHRPCPRGWTWVTLPLLIDASCCPNPSRIAKLCPLLS